MIELGLLLVFVGLLFYAYKTGYDSGFSAKESEELKKYADSVTKGIKARRAHTDNAALRDRVQDRFTE